MFSIMAMLIADAIHRVAYSVSARCTEHSDEDAYYFLFLSDNDAARIGHKSMTSVSLLLTAQTLEEEIAEDACNVFEVG